MNMLAGNEAWHRSPPRMRSACGPISALALVLALGGLPTALAQTGHQLPFGLIPEAMLDARFAGEVDPLWKGQVRQGEFKPAGGVRLKYASVLVPNERAAVVIVTGRTENLLKYREVMADLVRQNYSVYVYDHRGQGFSDRLLPNEREKGHVGRFDDYVDDLQAFVEQVVKRDPHRTLLVLGHSMGGGVATRHLERYPGVFAAAALSSPMHQPNAKILVSAQASCEWFKNAARFAPTAWPAGRAAPYVYRPYDEKTNEYTHSPGRWARLLKIEEQYPEVRLGGPTRGWAAEACAASDTLRSKTETAKIVAPVLVLQAGNDTAVMPQGQNAFCGALIDATGRPCDGGGPQRIEGARHELLQEADRYRVPAMTRILGFLDRHSAAPARVAMHR